MFGSAFNDQAASLKKRNSGNNFQIFTIIFGVA
jgi:hypothetical protein